MRYFKRNRFPLFTGDRIFVWTTYIVLAIVGIVTLYPFWNILVLSFNDAIDSIAGGIYLFPRKFTLDNFKTVLILDSLVTAFVNSILRTFFGVIASLASMTMLAYTLSRKDYIFGRIIQRIFIITMYVNGGLIPIYFVIKSLGLRNNFLVYIIPMLINAYYLIIIRSYIDTIPDSLQEAAKMDGANDLFIFYRIIAPLSIPVVATIALFVSVDQWNSWFDTFIYTSRKELTTLQFELMKVISRSTIQVENVNELRDRFGNGSQIVTTPESIRMAITIVVTIPILLVYPFIQRYFIKGMTIGAVKE